jgi:hypothetical protein
LVNCPARSLTRHRKPVGALSQIHQQIPGLLHSPRTVQMSSHAEDMDIARAHLDEEVHVTTGVRHRAVHTEEIARQHRGRLRPEELPTARPAALRRWRYLQPFQQPPHCGGSDPDPETEQFAGDPPVADDHEIP